MRPMRKRAARRSAGRICGSSLSRPRHSKPYWRCIASARCTATINAIRGLIGEFGLVAGKGAARLDELRRKLSTTASEQIPPATRLAIEELFTRVDDLRARVEALEAEIVAGHQANKASRRLAAIPGVGPLTASALVAAVGDGRQFRSSRHFAAWLGLTPRMASSGDKQRIGHISK